MSKYNLSELLTEVAGGRIGTLKISARDLVRKMEDLEDKGVKIDRFDGLSPDGKTYIEFHVHPMRKYDEDTSFSIYDYKFGFDPMSPEHSDKEYPFSIGGRSAARDSAETVLRSGDMGFEIREAKEEIKEDKHKDLINALRFQVMTLEKGIIDKDDFINAIEELAFGPRRGPNTDDDLEREQRMQMGMREAVSKDDIKKALKGTKVEIEAYMDSLKRSGDKFDSIEDYVEDFENYVADKSLQEHFKRFV